MGRRRKEPEVEPEQSQFGSYRRVAEAWASAPKPWREVQAEQLNDAMTQLRESDGDHKAETQASDGRRRRRFRLARRFSH